MANITVSDLYIDGLKMPTPALEGVTVTKEKVWSANTGRASSGNMLGTIVGVKTKLTIKWPPLTWDEAALIESAVSVKSRPFVPVQFTDVTGNTVTKTMYFGTPSYTVYSWADGTQYLKSVTVDGIEQ